jgi:hypothetical protein
MRDYGVMHRCVWQTEFRRREKQCSRRGRWLCCGFWFCRQHYNRARLMSCEDVYVCVAKADWVQERMLP